MNLGGQNKGADKTADPKVVVPRKQTGKAQTVFAVHKRVSSSSVQFDINLQVGRTLKSWVLPKGPSMNPQENRMALMEQDRPLSYAKQKGLVTKGRQVPETLEIWDSGTWEPTANFLDVEQALSKGLVEFILKGRKLKGRFILVEMEYSIGGNGWLLVKREDEQAVDYPYDPLKVK